MPIPDFVLELRRHLGTAELWLPGTTAVIRRDDPDRPGTTQVLLALRADNGEWAPVSGIVDPGEDPGVAARREAHEEVGVEIRVDRLAQVRAGERVTYANGDRTVYLDHTFACTWLSGEPAVGDDENTDVAWFDADDLPPMRDVVRQRVDVALLDEVATRFES